jgi:hypothetical protein
MILGLMSHFIHHRTFFAVALFLVMVLVGPSYAGLAKIVVLPFQFPPDNQELQKFSDHINKTLTAAVSAMNDRYQLESDSRVQLTYNNSALLIPDAQILKIGTDLQADLIVYGFLSADESRYSMKAVLWDLKGSRVLVSTEHRVSNIHELPGVLELFVGAVNRRLKGAPVLPFYRSEPTSDPVAAPRLPRPDLGKNTAPWRSPDIAATLSGLDIGDLVGDKKNETVFLDDGGIAISRFEQGGLKQLTQFSQFNSLHLAVEVEDVDHDGVAEIVLCYQTQNGIESCVIKYTNQNLRVVGRVPNVILRTIMNPDKESERILVGQKTDAEDIYTGEMTRYGLDGGRLMEIGSITLPPGTLLLSYDSGRLGKSNQFVRATLTQDQRLMIYDKENRLLTAVPGRRYGSERKIRIPWKQGVRELVLPGRILIGDIKGEGENELLVMKSADGGSVIEALTWDGAALVEKWKTVRSPGLITDFRIGDFKNEGVRSLVLILVKPNLFTFMAPQSVIFAYDFIP